MIVTINTDAAYRRDIQRGGYAFWIVSNSGRFCHGGVLRKKVKSSCIAEMMCIVNAIDALGKLGWTYIDKIVLNTDSMNSKHIIEKNKKAIKQYNIRYLCPYGDKFWDVMSKHNLKGIPIDIRHVPSHVSTETKKQWVNQWCDSEAKKHLKEYVDKTKKTRN